ncbi:MAG: division/cell wall cluster transcriptional repressor MraZ [Chloroflexi bacterium]|nr:MAG: division/cell wall cluster transcriptional repressor MraZ [Chloroflexota bacterium]
MFLGEYEHRLDPKGRVAIPSRFREEFKDGLVLTRGVEKCLAAYPVSEWQKVAERLASLPATRLKSRRLSRFVFASAFYLEPDRLGRILLPPPLRQYAEVKDVVVIVGVNSYVEIWDKKLWEEEKALMSRQAWQLMEGIELR